MSFGGLKLYGSELGKVFPFGKNDMSQLFEAVKARFQGFICREKLKLKTFSIMIDPLFISGIKLSINTAAAFRFKFSSDDAYFNI